FFFLRDSKESESAKSKVVVLPFSTLNLEKDSTKNLDVFSDGIQTKLSKLDAVTLLSASVSSSYKNSRLNPMAIGEELKVRFVVEGIVRKEHDVNYVAVRIYDTKRGGEIWEQKFSGNQKELFNIREKVCVEIYGILNSVAGEEQGIREAEQFLASHKN